MNVGYLAHFENPHANISRRVTKMRSRIGFVLNRQPVEAFTGLVRRNYAVSNRQHSLIERARLYDYGISYGGVGRIFPCIVQIDVGMIPHHIRVPVESGKGTSGVLAESSVADLGVSYINRIGAKPLLTRLRIIPSEALRMRDEKEKERNHRQCSLFPISE